MTRAERVAMAASGAVGARFRLHGRDAATGLDCIGLAVLALRAGGWAGVVPGGYALRGHGGWRIGDWIGDDFMSGDGKGPGELRLFDVGPGQWHVGIGTARGLVHADAALRCVVERPGEAPWRRIGAWRLAE